MDASTIHTLKELDNAFYAANHESFSQTRNHPWEGWKRVLAAMGNCPSTVLDMACGNMRFKAFLENEVGSGVCEYHGVDSCPSLLPPGHGGSFQQLDLIDELVAGTLAQRLRAPECDLTVCGGCRCYIPSGELRA